MTSSKGGIAPEKWSSLIGIVTAICGNILISFALNTQRYAHMRLSRDREEWEMKQRRQRKKKQGYGTQQEEVAEQRSEANHQSQSHPDQEARHPKYDKYALQEPEESDPLIPSVESVPSRKSSDPRDEDGPGLGDDEDNPNEKSYLRSPIWWIGISMMTIGEAGNFLAYGFAPASIVSPLGVVALISNCLIAPFLLRERFRWRDGLGVIIAVAGCVIIVMSASQSNPKLDPDRIWGYITTWEFETYLCVTIILIIVLAWASNKFGDKTILIDLGLMGLFGGYTALSTKGVASLLSSSTWKVLTFPITYLLVAILVFTAVMQIKYVNRALQRFNSTMVIPVQFVLFTLSVIVGSAILYRDFERTTTEDAVKFVGGCALTFSGVWFITSGRNNDADDDQEIEDEEDAVDLVDEEGMQPEIRERDDGENRRSSLLASPSKDALLNRRHTADHSTSNGEITPADGTQIDKPADMSPAKAAAIHDHSASGLYPQTNNGTQPPPFHATTSQPEVPTIDLSSSVPTTPLRRGKSGDPTDTPTRAAPSTPTPRHPNGQHPEPNSSKLLNRHSIVGFVPGPYTSPLSSSLSAIVADTLRRGVDHMPGSSLRRPSFRRIRKSGLNPNDPPQKRHSIASGEMDFGPPETPSAASGGSAAGEGGRVRSLSATLHDVFASPGRSKSLPQTTAETPQGNAGGNGNEGR